MSTVDDTGLEETGITWDEFAYAAVTASERWNDQANSGWFKFQGTTSLSEVDCSETPPKNIVRIVAASGQGGSPNASGRCYNSATQRYDAFIIYIRKFNSAPTPVAWDWGISNLQEADERDLIKTLVHEFGHALRQGHPTDDGDGLEYSVMSGSLTGTSMGRDLWQLDSECAVERYGVRDLKAVRHYVSSGVVGSSSTYTGSWSVFKATAGATKHTGTWKWSSALNAEGGSPDCPRWTKDLDTSETECLTESEGLSQAGVGFVDVTWRDVDEGMDRVFYSEYLDYSSSGYAPYEKSSAHRLRYRRSSSGFAGMDIAGVMQFCPDMTGSSPGLLSCNTHSADYIYSSHPISVAWENGVGRTVHAWVNQNREDPEDSETNEVRLSVGAEHNAQLPMYDTIGIQARVGPGVACRNNLAHSSNDCIIAYVDNHNDTPSVRVKLFEVSSGSERFNVSDDPSTYVTSFKTGTSLAAFYHGSYFWIVAKSANAGQDVVVLRSDDGRFWSQQANLGFSVTSPSTVGYLHGTNVIVLTKEK